MLKIFLYFCDAFCAAVPDCVVDVCKNNLKIREQLRTNKIILLTINKIAYEQKTDLTLQTKNPTAK